MSTHLIFLGAPGVGKGTQSKLIAGQLAAAHISTGDILRQAVKDQTELGLKAKGYMDKGDLVPDELILALIESKMSESDFPDNWIMDGFPRNPSQAEAFDGMLKNLGQSLSAVVNIEVPMDLLMDRLTLRRTCRKTGEIFNLKFNPPENPENHDLYQRADDTEEAVKRRLDVYTEQTQPLIEYYQSRDLLKNINGDQSVEQVTQDILNLVK